MARGESSCTTSRAGRSLNHCRQFGLMTRTRNNIFWQALFSLFFALARISLTVFINVDCIRDIICVNYSRGLCGVMMTRGSQLLPRKARVHPQRPPPPTHKVYLYKCTLLLLKHSQHLIWLGRNMCHECKKSSN